MISVNRVAHRCPMGLKPTVWMYTVLITGQKTSEGLRATSRTLSDIEYWASGYRDAVETITTLRLPIIYTFDKDDGAEPT